MLLDNKKNGFVGDTLKSLISDEASISAITNELTLPGIESILDKLANSRQLDLLLSSVETDAEGKRVLGSLAGNSCERRQVNELRQAALAKALTALLSKANVKAVKHPGLINQNLFHVKNVDNTQHAIQGSSGISLSGLGFVPSTKFEMNTLYPDQESAGTLKEWFNSIWEDASATEDFKASLLAQLEILSQDNSPEFIYFLTLYHLFNDLLEELDEDNIIKSKTGFKDTVVWNKLYKFQKDGVLGAIDKLEKYNGCIIADSVGLGKTFEALAVIKYYELRNDRVLVLAPKKLRENWTIYTVNDKLNTLASDRFNFDVLNHTDLTRNNGKSGEINLETVNWANYDLVVIDESHNFRNNGSTSKSELTRYGRLMQDIIKSGVKTKVLMLSATPVNNRMNDLKNQVAFITEAKDDALDEHGITSIEQTLKKAQARFNQWLNLDPDERTVESLLSSMNFDYFKLLDMLTIARSRRHIEKYYNLEEIGAFPERLQPQNIKADIDTENEFPALKEINKTIRRMNLSAYSPLKYVKIEKREEYSQKYDKHLEGGSVFKQVDREQSLIHLMRINILKRMESSINSFSLTLEKLLNQVETLLERIDAHDSQAFEDMNIGDIQIDDPAYDSLLIGRKVKVLLNDIDDVKWRQDLEDDREKLISLLEYAKQVDPVRDAKLADLMRLISHKVNNPLNSGNKKLIIFTAFSDTAEYLYKHIAGWANEKHGIQSALVTGDSQPRCTISNVRRDLNSILTNFSPVSKDRAQVDATAETEIDLLIATDCISEGQNLQDCDFLVNYDIHWNPVRIIQRFGRIDRLGSKNKSIQLVNFWPNMELDEYINLEARVSGRMVLLDISATGEENVIDNDGKKQMNDLEYRRKQMEQLQNNVVDLEDMSGGVSITDLTLNDFRMDLTEYMKTELPKLESAPKGLFAVSSLHAVLENELPSGVIFCLRNLNADDRYDHSYPLKPHYLVYVSDDGEVVYPFTQTKKILDVLKKHGIGYHYPDKQIIASFNQATEQGDDMSHYQALLKIAIDSIIGEEQAKGMESLFQRGGTQLAKQHSRGGDDFEVISFMVLKNQ
jgi:SNF2 family DNA or RNA helicase